MFVVKCIPDFIEILGGFNHFRSLFGLRVEEKDSVFLTIESELSLRKQQVGGWAHGLQKSQTYVY